MLLVGEPDRQRTEPQTRPDALGPFGLAVGKQRRMTTEVAPLDRRSSLCGGQEFIDSPDDHVPQLDETRQIARVSLGTVLVGRQKEAQPSPEQPLEQGLSIK